MAKKLKHMKLNGLESDIFDSQKRTLNLKLQHLAEGPFPNETQQTISG